MPNEVPPPLRNQKLNWLRYLLRIRQSWRSGNAVFTEKDLLPLSTALYGRRPRGWKDYEVKFDCGFKMTVRQTREQSFADIRGKSELHRYEPIRQHITPGLKMLDAAAGAGYPADWLRSAGANVTGLDLSETAFEYARHRYPEIPFVRGSVLELPFEAETFEAVTSVETIEHIPEAHKMVAEVHRVLKPGGWWYVTTPVFGHCGSPYHVKEFTRAEFVELLGAKFGPESGWKWVVDDGAWMAVMVRK